MCCELSKLKGEEVEEEAADARSSFSALQVQFLFYSFREQHVCWHVCFHDSFVAEFRTYLWLTVSTAKCLRGFVTSAWTCLCTEGSIVTCRGRTVRSVFASKSSTWGSSWTPGRRRTVSRFSDWRRDLKMWLRRLFNFSHLFVCSHLRLLSSDVLQGEQKISLHYQFTWWYLRYFSITNNSGELNSL